MALTLAFGITIALNIVVAAVLWDAIRSAGPGLSENATQVLSGAFGGIIGILGSYLGFRVGVTAAQSAPPTAPPPPPEL